MALRSVRIHNVKSLLRGFKAGDAASLRGHEYLFAEQGKVTSRLNPAELTPGLYDMDGKKLKDTQKTLHLKAEAETLLSQRIYRLLTKDQTPDQRRPASRFSKTFPIPSKQLIKTGRKLKFRPERVITMGAYR